MSEEELKAIENYKMFEDAIKQTISKGDKELYIDNLEAALRDTRILLSLIEKQQKEIENSVSKEKIEEYLKEAEEKYQVYKKGVKDNEALKSGMWKHLGEVDVLKRILGKQRNVVTLDNKLLGE